MSVDPDKVNLHDNESKMQAYKKKISDQEKEIEVLKQDLEQTRSKLEEKIERLSTLIDVGNSINSTLDLDQLLTYLMTCATKVMKAKDSSLMLMDELKNELVFRVALGEKGKQVQEFRLKMGQGIAGQVALSGQPIVVSDAKEDERWERSIDLATGFDTKSIMCVPIKLREKVIGVIEVLNAGLSGPLSEEDLDLFSAFANTAAVSLQNARLFAAIHCSFEHISDLLNSGALMTDESGELVMINSIARNLLGFSDGKELSIQDLGQLKSSKNIVSLLNNAFDEAKSLKEIIQLGDKKDRKVALDIAPVIDPNGMKIGTVAVLNKA
jgi:transcriptional regulator with GAF, ATPase, and Fis domain